MSYTVEDEYGHDLECDSMVEIMSETRVFEIEENGLSGFRITEGCDDNYCVDITPEQLEALGNELIALAKSV